MKILQPKFWQKIIDREFPDCYNAEILAKELNGLQKAIKKGLKHNYQPIRVVIDKPITRQSNTLIFHLIYVSENGSIEKVWPWDKQVADVWGMKTNQLGSGYLRFTYKQGYPNMDYVLAATEPFTNWLKKHTGLNIQLTNSATL
jgi:hypothetical protein